MASAHTFQGLVRLAKLTGIHVSALSHYYHQRRIPSIHMAKRIADGRGITLDALYHELYDVELLTHMTR